MMAVRREAQGNPVVAIVDAYSTARHLAPLFHGRGYDCVHVQSTAKLPEDADTFRSENFIDNVVLSGDRESLVTAIAAHRPVAVLAGADEGVEVVDFLSERLGLRTNGTALSHVRRDKFSMVEAIKAAGLRGASQTLATDGASLLRWYGSCGFERVVVKPLHSTGNDGVFFCQTEDEVASAFDQLVGTDNALQRKNNAVVAQEYLEGAEYYVNTVSVEGRHFVSDVHSTSHLNVNGILDLLGGSQLLPRRGPVQDELTAYAFAVLDVLGITNGPAHTELKLTPDGPCLVETHARVCGADLPLLVRSALGESQLEWTVDAYVNPERFDDPRRSDYVIDRHAVCVNMISSGSGVLVAYPKLDQLRSLPSFHAALVRVAPGQQIDRTVGDFSYPILIHLLHPSLTVVERDYATIRYLDGDGFYQVAKCGLLPDGRGKTNRECGLTLSQWKR